MAQNDSAKTKSGWNFGLLPTITYSSDLGFEYGALVDLYNYGDGTLYPNFKQRIYVEWSRYTKGSGTNRVFFDSKHLIPGIRTTFDVAYYTETALDFYGFNGYESKVDFDKTASDNSNRMFYKMQRQTFQLKADFQGKTPIKNLNWIAGWKFLHVNLDSVNIDKMNEGKDETDSKYLKYGSLYTDYVKWGIIAHDEANGGLNNFLKLGLVYDTRDNEPNPMKGMWTEAVFSLGPKWLGNPEYGYGKFSFIHRQYFTLVPDRLSFVYRIGGQATIFGKAPFYLEPLMVYSFYPSSSIGEGLGNSKTLRGIIRNRVVGDAIAYGNFEFRWKVAYFKFINQNWYVALNPFIDMGTVLKDYAIDKTLVPSSVYSQYFDQTKDNIHASYGCGVHLAMNQNFIIAADMGKAFDKRDGTGLGIYIGMNYLF